MFVCECASVSVCNWFYKLIHGPQKQILGFFLDLFGLEKSWKNHGTFFWDSCGTHFGYFDLEIRFVHAMTCNGFELQSPNLRQIYILGYPQLVLKIAVIDLDIQGHLAISTQETTFNVALLYWSRPAKGCYTPKRALVFFVFFHFKSIQLFHHYGDILYWCPTGVCCCLRLFVVFLCSLAEQAVKQSTCWFEIP